MTIDWDEVLAITNAAWDKFEIMDGEQLERIFINNTFVRHYSNMSVSEQAINGIILALAGSAHTLSGSIEIAERSQVDLIIKSAKMFLQPIINEGN